MSKERELLARVLTSELWSVQEELQSEIKELLAEPEQAPEPVAWMYEFTGDLDVRLERTGRVILLLEKQDWVESCTTGSYVESPLYTSPPKREPSMTGREMYQRGYAAAERDLKRKPLSDAELIARYETIRISSFYAGFRDAEKMHGIGEGND
jgi:hypothetical protein